MDMNELYEQRIRRFDDVMSRKLPDRVPVVPNMNTWMYQFAGISVKKHLRKTRRKFSGRQNI